MKIVLCVLRQVTKKKGNMNWSTCMHVYIDCFFGFSHHGKSSVARVKYVNFCL